VNVHAAKDNLLAGRFVTHPTRPNATAKERDDSLNMFIDIARWRWTRQTLVFQKRLE